MKSTWKFYHNPQCSKCREALAWLETESIDFQAIEYIKNPLTVDELQALIKQLNIPMSALVRVKDPDFVSSPFDVNSAAEVALRLSEKPHLMERPVLQGQGRATVGRPLENMKALIKS